MKKLVTLLVCLVLVFSLCACGNSEPEQEDEQAPEVTDKADTDTEKNADAKESGEEGAEQKEDEPSVGMPNPMTAYDSLDEVNNAVGGNLCGPAAMGVSDEEFYVIDAGSYKLGEYRFKVNGYEYSLRCSKTPEDISGIYLSGGEGTAFSGVDGSAVGEELDEGIYIFTPDQAQLEDENVTSDANGIQFNGDSEYKCARWFVGDMQYVLSANDGGELEQETFESVAGEFMLRTQGNM